MKNLTFETPIKSANGTMVPATFNRKGQAARTFAYYHIERDQVTGSATFEEAEVIRAEFLFVIGN